MMNQQPEETLKQLILSGAKPEDISNLVELGVQQGKVKPEIGEAIIQALQGLVKAARHGAKLQYLRSLKNQCPEGEELYYYKKGGSVGCGCKKKEEGGEIQEAKYGAVAKFKKARKADSGTKIMLLAEANKLRKAKEATEAAAKKEQLKKAKTWGGSLIYYADKNATYGNKKEPKEQDNAVRDRKENPENNRINKVPRKACGSKVEKKCNGAVAKFKAACGYKIKKNQLGGSLNGIPFYLGGTNEGGILSMSELIPIYGTYKAGQNFFKNPSWRGAAELGVSALGDLALVTGVGAGAGLALKGAKAAKAAKNIAKGVSSATRAAKAEKAKKYYDASAGAFNDAAILYGGSSAGKAISKLSLK